jgi:hypothetical protein
VQHTSTSSMSSGSTTCLFYRDLGARQLTTRSLQDISNGSETHRGERTYGHCLDSTAKKGRRIGEEPRFRIIRSEKGWECSLCPSLKGVRPSWSHAYGQYGRQWCFSIEHIAGGGARSQIYSLAVALYVSAGRGEGGGGDAAHARAHTEHTVTRHSRLQKRLNKIQISASRASAK